MAGWTAPYLLLRDEFTQHRTEGYAIPSDLQQRFAELAPAYDAKNTAAGGVPQREDD